MNRLFTRMFNNTLYLYIYLSLMIVFNFFSTHAHAQTWGYYNTNGPEKWGELDKQFLLCKTGQSQTPIDLRDAINASLGDVHFMYVPSDGDIENKKHTVQFNLNSENNIRLGIYPEKEEIFKLIQIHFHTPSEHTINGVYFPLEAHFVHLNTNHQTTVVSVLFKEGPMNPIIETLLDNTPLSPLQAPQNVKKINISNLIPHDTNNYFLYNGSLTTPPCSENVRWVVLKTPVTASAEQIKEFLKLMGKNNRPLQKINTRFLLD